MFFRAKTSIVSKKWDDDDAATYWNVKLLNWYFFVLAPSGSQLKPLKEFPFNSAHRTYRRRKSKHIKLHTTQWSNEDGDEEKVKIGFVDYSYLVTY